MLLAYAYRFGIPDAGLNLADVGAAHHKHAKSRLTDASSDSQGELVVKKHFVEGKVSSFVTVCKRELAVERLAVNSYAHRGYFK